MTMQRSLLSAVFLAWLFVMLPVGSAGAKLAPNGQAVTAVTEYSYAAGPNESRETARALGLYGAKQRAVSICVERLVAQGLLEERIKRRKEILCLVNDSASYRLLESTFDKGSRTFTIKIIADLSLADFVKAEIRNEELNDEERHFTLREEMEPSVSSTLEPALELSRAYRYISNQRWRMAIIYTDHLETKYLHWGDLQLAKAMAYLGMHETEKALSSLRSACNLGTQEACLKLNLLDPPD
jgi:hypothetical protein